MGLSVETLAVAKKYTDSSISGISGTLAGKNCTIQSITEIEGGHRVTFQWTADDSTTRTSTMDVMDGVDGEVPAENLLKDTVGWTGKNLLKNTATSQTINDVTFTVNADKSVTVNGTATADAVFVIHDRVTDDLNISPGNYIGSGITNGVSGKQFMRFFCTRNGSAYVYGDIINGEITISVQSGDIVGCLINITSGQTVNNLTFYPMIRDASITDSTFEPYHKSVEDWYWENNPNAGVHNYCKVTATSTTTNNITFTVNTNGSVTVSTTNEGASSDTIFEINAGRSNYLPINTYKMTGTPSTGSRQTYYMFAQERNASDNGWIGSAVEDVGKGIIFDRTTTNKFAQAIVIKSGTVMNNITFYPMFCDAKDTYDGFTDYAMTNRELTDAVNSTILSGILPQLHLNKLYGYDASSAINIDTIHKPLGYMIRVITTGSGLSGTVPSEIGNALLIIGFSSMVNNGVEFGAQIALGFGADKIAFRRAGYNASGGSWGAWKYITIS